MTADQARLKNKESELYDHAEHSGDYRSVKPIADDEWFLFVGDTVQLKVGPDKYKTGRISHVHRARNCVKVASMHMRLVYHKGQKAFGQPGSYTESEQWIDVKHVELIDPVTGKTTVPQWHVDESSGRPVRVTAAGSPLPISFLADKTSEYTTTETYEECVEKDTTAEDAMTNTFLMAEEQRGRPGTFEHDILKECNIKETRTYKQTWWY